jgi:tripartite-type tricarboxylate transporter receptor subunit TctC
MRLAAAWALALATLVGFTAQAQAQAPIRIIVPWPAGGQVDSLARVLAPHLRESSGHPVLVENKPGASSAIGMRECALAKPDGFTFCMSVPDSLSYNPHVFDKLPYDPTAFVGIAHLGWTNGLIVGNSSARFASLKEALAAGKGSGAPVFWATWGDASIPDVYLRWINHRSATRIEAVPYKGAAPANQAVLAGEAQVTYMGLGVSRPHVLKGTVRPLAATGKHRSTLYPDVATLDELGLDPGLPGYFAFYAPPGTPDAIVRHMHTQLQAALDTPTLRQFRATYAMDAPDMNLEQFQRFMAADRQRAGDVFRALGFQPSSITP